MQETKNIKCVFPFWLLTPYSMLHAPCSMPYVPCSMPYVPCSMPYVPCSLLSIDLLPALAIDEMEIAGIDKNPGTLAHDEHRISPVNGITE
jgi:hypothetical protein